MSKMDNLRAMREARYDRATARARETASTKPPSSPPVPAVPARERPPATVAEAEPADELCGHRNMGGRTCTRERGHAAKSHRYS